MAKRKRWNGEFLVEVRPDGSVLLPVFDYDRPAPTHYRVQKDNYNDIIHLIPMKLATAEDLEPPEPEPPKPSDPEWKQRPYTADELVALSLECPYCGVEEGKGCITRTSGRLLIDYRQEEGQSLVHAKRLELVREMRQIERSKT